MSNTLRFLLVLLLCVFATPIFAQDGEPKDSTEVETKETYEIGDDEDGEEEDGDGSIVVEFSIGSSESDDGNFTTRWFTLGLGVNPVHVDGDFDLPNTDFYNDFDLRVGKSTNVDLGIVQQKLNLVNHRLYLYTGLGFDINKYMFDENFVIDPHAETWQTDWPQDIGDVGIKKNRLTATYIHIPLMLNFESADDHFQSFHLSAGGFVGIRMGSNQKIKFKDKDDNFIDGDKIYKEKDSFNLQTVNYGIKSEIGFGPINVYSKYHLNELFDEESTDPLNNFSIGVMILPF